MKTLRIVFIFVLLVSLSSPVEGSALVSRVHLKLWGILWFMMFSIIQLIIIKQGHYDFTPMFQAVKEALQADILVGT